MLNYTNDKKKKKKKKKKKVKPIAGIIFKIKREWNQLTYVLLITKINKMSNEVKQKLLHQLPFNKIRSEV